MSLFYKENAELEQKMQLFFDALEIYNREHYAGRVSVVLLGSLSRGEGSWIYQNGKTVLLSDIEFFTVYPSDMGYPDGFEEYLQSLSKTSFREYISGLFHVDNSYFSESELGTMEKKLLTYDAVHFGKCVVGKNVMPLFPQVDIHNINLFDIRDIMTHRVFSVLYYGIPLKEQGNEEQYKYSLAKNSLDLMTVMLVEHGILASGFTNRYNIIKELDIDQKIIDYFGYCLSIKLGDSYERTYTVQEMERLFISLVKELNENFHLHFSNYRSNMKSILRRRLGILKRALKYRNCAFPKGHLSHLIATLESDGKITIAEKKDNLVLNGYPTNEEK